jgi:hypothetical protein
MVKRPRISSDRETVVRTELVAGGQDIFREMSCLLNKKSRLITGLSVVAECEVLSRTANF